MATNYVQEGKTMLHTATADIVSGQVVRIGQMLGVAETDIANGDTGAVTIRGVFTVPKVSAAVIGKGDTLTWDASAGAFDDQVATPATGDVTGPGAVAMEAGTNGMTTLSVLFTGSPGTVA